MVTRGPRPKRRKGDKGRGLHIYVLRRDGLRVPDAASEDDNSRKNFQSFLNSVMHAMAQTPRRRRKHHPGLPAFDRGSSSGNAGRLRCLTSEPHTQRASGAKDFARGLRQSKIVMRIRLARLPGLGGFRYFDKVAGVDIIDIAVNRDIF